MHWEILIYVFVLLITLTYALLFLRFLFGWYRLKRFKVGDKLIVAQNSFSIIIPARNEAKRISKLLNTLKQIDYHKERFEIIVVDDHSSDDTCEVVNASIDAFRKREINIKLISLANNESVFGKKAAITAGIQASSHEWILTTDADCVVKVNWLKTLDAFIQEHKDAVLISGPVTLKPLNSFFHKIQGLELMGLIGIGASSIRLGTPNLCNGANLAYRKSVFNKLSGFKGIDHLASGDDELLMHKVAEKYPGRIYFLNAFESVVSSPPANRLKSFIAQRKRWVSKGKHYKSLKLKTLLLLIYCYYFLILLLALALIWSTLYLSLFCMVLIVKLFVEFIFLFAVCKRFKSTKLLLYFLLAQPLQIMYVLFIGLYGSFGRFSWKGRILK